MDGTIGRSGHTCQCMNSVRVIGNACGLNALPRDSRRRLAMVYEKALNIYVDGSSYSHPRRGGMGIRYVTINEQGNEVVQNEVLPGYESATNNEMELLASIKGLSGAPAHRRGHPQTFEGK